jgi:hypothetical protein
MPKVATGVESARLLRIGKKDAESWLSVGSCAQKQISIKTIALITKCKG